MEYADHQGLNNNSLASHPPSQAAHESRNSYEVEGDTACPYSDCMIDPHLSHTALGTGSRDVQFSSFSSYTNTSDCGRNSGGGSGCIDPYTMYETDNVGGSSLVEPLATFSHSTCHTNSRDGLSGGFSAYPSSLIDTSPQVPIPVKSRGYVDSFSNVEEISTTSASATQFDNYPRLHQADIPYSNHTLKLDDISQISGSTTLEKKRSEITKKALGGRMAVSDAEASSNALIGAPPKYANSRSEFLVAARPKLVERFRRNRAIMMESFETLIGHWVDQARVPVEMSDQAIERVYLARSCGIFRSIATSSKKKIRDACEKIERSRKNAEGSRPSDDSQRVSPENAMSSTHHNQAEEISSKHSTPDDELLELAVAYMSDHAGLLFSSHEAFLMFVEIKCQEIRGMTENEKVKLWNDWPGYRFENEGRS